MPLVLELGSIHDAATRRAFENLILQIPGLLTTTGGGAETDPIASPALATHAALTTSAHGGIVASTDPRLTDARAPSGVIAGDLAGSTWPTLDIAAGAIVNADINAAAAIAKSKLASLDVVNADVNAAAAIAETKLNLATDAAAGTGSRRTLGTTATSAAAGNRGLPTGGTSGQVLTKNSATNYDAGWTTASGGGATMVGGRVTSTGSITAGTGFTVSKIGTGHYRLTFTSITPLSFAGNTWNFADRDIVTTDTWTSTTLDVWTINGGSGAVLDRGFTFIVMAA